MSAVEAPEVAVFVKWSTAVAQAALPFESRWTERALRRVDPDLFEAWTDQCSMWRQAQVTGSVEDLEEHGSATVRAYGAVVRRLEEASEPDDAYLLGFDGRTGTRVAIGDAKAAAERVRELHGEAVTWLTPDECAALLAGVDAFQKVAAIKKLWPGAEAVREERP